MQRCAEHLESETSSCLVLEGGRGIQRYGGGPISIFSVSKTLGFVGSGLQAKTPLLLCVWWVQHGLTRNTVYGAVCSPMEALFAGVRREVTAILDKVLSRWVRSGHAV